MSQLDAFLQRLRIPRLADRTVPPTLAFSLPLSPPLSIFLPLSCSLHSPLGRCFPLFLERLLEA